MLEHNSAQATLDYIISEDDLRSPPDLAKLQALFRQAPEITRNYFFRDDQAAQIMQQIRSNSGPPSAVLGRRFVLAEARDAQVEVLINEDKMEARIRASGAYGGQAVNLDLIRAALRRAGVTTGLDSVAITTLLREGAELSAGNSRELLIARGRAPQNGDSARLERLTRTAAERMLQPKVREDGSVDMRDLGELVTIGKGELLMRKHEASPGIDGYDVCGTPLPAQAGEDRPLIAGDGAAYHPADANLLIAMRDGTPVSIDNGMKVDDVMALKKVDVSTGHVRFKGSVIIEGDVREGMEVESEGDVTIGGCIDNASVKAGGTVACKQGIIGHSRSDSSDPNSQLSTHVSAGRDIHCAFAQYAHLTAGLSIHIEKLLSHSKVTAGERLIVGNGDRPAGKLFGGEVSVGHNLLSGEIGTDAGARTLIDLGGHIQQLRDLMTQQVTQFKQQRSRIDELNRQLAELQQIHGQTLNTDMMIAEQELADLHESNLPLKEELRRSRDQHDALLQQLDAKTFRNLRAGTVFRYLGKTLVIDHDHGPCRVHLVEGVLTLEPLKY